MNYKSALFTAALVTTAGTQAAELLDTLDPDTTASIIAIAVSPDDGNLAIYEDFAAEILIIDQQGIQVGSVPRPGNSSNDFDLDYALSEMTIGGSAVPAGSLLIFNGDDSPETLYAEVSDIPGSEFASTELSSASLVGGAHLPGTNNVATVEFIGGDFVRILSANDGSELGFFDPGPQPFDIFYGDIDVAEDTGELTIVSSSQNIIRQLTPEGFCVRDLIVDSFGISGMSGVAIDDSTGNLWISSTNGSIYHLDPRPNLGDSDGDGLVDFDDNCVNAPNPNQDDSDGDGIGNSCDADLVGTETDDDDCVVNFLDLAALADAFLSTPASANWNPDADIWGPTGEPDGIVNFLDVSRLPQLFLAPPGPSGRGNLCGCGL